MAPTPVGSNQPGKGIFVISRPGDGDQWRGRMESEFRTRGLLAELPSEAYIVVVLIGREFEQSWISTRRPQLNLSFITQTQIRHAFAEGKQVISVLVDGARIPDSRELPGDIQQLAYQPVLKIETEADLPKVIAHIISTGRTAAGGRGRGKAAGRQDRSVFISYRRDDSHYWAHELARSLSLKLGSKRVFLDVGSIQPGRDFRKQIENTIRRSTDVAVLIGAGFFEPNARGVRRIDSSSDYVRLEIRLALSLQKRIHVVLVGEADMPTRQQLPQDIAGLAKAWSVFRFNSTADADSVANGIIRGIAIHLPESAHDILAASVVQALSDYGWKAKGSGEQIILTNDEFDGFRLRYRTEVAEILLEERATSGLSLASGKWIQRRVFLVSPNALDDLDTLRLPDDLLEAALDPERYLGRVGRMDLKRVELPPVQPDTFNRLLRQAQEPNPQAMEAYLRMKRNSSPERLTGEKQIQLSKGKQARAVAFLPNGNRMVVATDGGAIVLSERGQTLTRLRFSGMYVSLAISRNGQIAAGSWEGSLTILNPGANRVANSVSPYSVWKRAKRSLSDNSLELKTLSWSPKGDRLACCGADAMWMYFPTTNEFSRWEYPVERALNSNYGAQFAPNGEELVAYAHGKFVWVVRGATQKIRGRIELASPPDPFRRSRSQPRESQSSPAFYNILDIDVNPQGSLLACAGSDGQIMLYDFKSLQPVKLIVGHEPMKKGFATRVEVVAFSPDGRWLLSLGSENRLIVWNTASWQPVREASVSWRAHREGRSVVAWSADSTRIAACGAEGTLYVWRL